MSSVPMVRGVLVAATVLATLAASSPPPALAQGGAGLYEPFPEPVQRHRARDFFGSLIPTSVPADGLRSGVVLPAGRALATAGAGDQGASRRAGTVGDTGTASDLAVGLTLVVAAVGAAGGATVVLRRRLPAEPR